MQNKTLPLVTLAIVSVGIVFASMFLLLPLLTRPRISLEDKVESYYVHFENGETRTVLPTASEGAKLQSACEDFMSNILGQLLWAVTNEEMSHLKNSTEYVEVTLNQIDNFTFFMHYSNVNKEAAANRILFFLSGSYKGTVLYARVEAKEVVWGGSYGAESWAVQNLIAKTSELS